MDISAAASVGNSATTARTGLSGIAGEDFLKILVKQLQFQDPLKPMDNQQMVEQMGTIRELEMNTRLSQKLELLTEQQRFGAAAALIGREVRGIVADSDGNEYEIYGKVQSVRFTNKGEAILELDNGASLPLAKLTYVQNVTETPPVATGEQDTTTQNKNIIMAKLFG